MNVYLSSPTTRNQVRDDANAFVREHARSTYQGLDPFPIMDLLDSPKLCEITGFELSVEEDSSLGEDVMGNVHGDELRLTESTYLGVLAGNPRSRFHAVHELAHARLHREVLMAPVDQTVRLPYDAVPFEANTEMQADYWTIHAMMPNLAVMEILTTPFFMDKPDQMLNKVASTFGVELGRALERLDLLIKDLPEMRANRKEAEVVVMAEKKRAEQRARLSSNRSE